MEALDRDMAAAWEPVTVLPGQHLCCVVDCEEERADRVASWTREGLAAGERVMCVEPRQHGAGFLRGLEEHGVDWKSGARDGQVVVSSPEDTYLAGGAFDPERRVSALATFVERSVAEGYPAVRLAAEATVARAVVSSLAGLLDFEARLEALSRTHPLSGLCFYDRRAFGPDLAACVRAHPRAVADGQVRAWAEPGRVRLAGEVDVSNVDLVAALLARAATNGGELHVDLGDVSFIDIAGTAQLVELARRLAPGRRVRVVAAPPQLGTILQAAGWDDEVEVLAGEVAR